MIRHSLIFLFGLAVFATLLPACQSTGGVKPTITLSPRFDPSVYSRFAIYVEDRTGRRLGNGVIRAIDDEFARAAIGKGYTVATRSDMDSIERELRIQASDFTETAIAKRARALNVSAIIIVSINNFELERYKPLSSMIFDDQKYKMAYRSNIGISARMISADEAQVIWVGSHSASKHVGETGDYGAAAQNAPEIAAIIAGGLPNRLPH